MVINKDQPIAMPRPFGSVNIPTITVKPRADQKEGLHFTVQINGVIEHIYQFLEFMVILDHATEKDKIDVMLDTPGGCVFTTQYLLERMNSCKATVTTIASGLVASAGTFLWFFSKQREVQDWALFMFHSSSHGDVGKTLAIQETSTEMVKYMQKTIKAMIADGILTAEEATAIFRQKKDLFVPGKIVRARMLAEMAATEGLRLVAEDGEYTEPKPGEDNKNDHPTDPDGKKDEQAQDDVDGEKTAIDPAAIFRAEGVEPAEGDEGGDNGEGAGDDNGTGDDDDGEGNPEDKCGKGGKKKAAKKGKKAKKPRGEGEEGDDGEGAGEGEAGSEENPVDPEEATNPSDFLKW